MITGAEQPVRRKSYLVGENFGGTGLILNATVVASEYTTSTPGKDHLTLGANGERIHTLERVLSRRELQSAANLRTLPRSLITAFF